MDTFRKAGWLAGSWPTLLMLRARARMAKRELGCGFGGLPLGDVARQARSSSRILTFAACSGRTQHDVHLDVERGEQREQRSVENRSGGASSFEERGGLGLADNYI